MYLKVSKSVNLLLGFIVVLGDNNFIIWWGVGWDLKKNYWPRSEIKMSYVVLVLK